MTQLVHMPQSRIVLIVSDNRYLNSHRHVFANPYDTMLFELGLAGDFPSAVRTNKFVTAPETAPKLASVSVALSIGIRVLGSFFKSASRYGVQQNRSILPLTFRSSSAKRAIDTALQHLGDERHASWVPLVGATFDWTSHLYLAGTVPMWVLVGNLFKRFVEDLNCFPWLWGALLDDDVDGVTKHSIARGVLGRRGVRHHSVLLLGPVQVSEH